MVTLRATAKVLKYLPAAQPVAQDSDTALGDWYVNRMVIERRPVLLIVSSRSLLSILEPARDVRSLPERLPGIVAAKLERLGVDRGLANAEVAAMAPTVVAKTRDRSVLGSMVDFAKVVPYYLPDGSWDDAWLPMLEMRLADTPCRVTRPLRMTFYPVDESVRLLAEKWGAAGD